jgi:hypothetical protein
VEASPRENRSAARYPRNAKQNRPLILLILTLTLASLLYVGSRLVHYYQSPTFGHSCMKGCRSGFCYTPEGQFFANYCTRTCSRVGGCPDGYACVSSADPEGLFCKRNPSLELGKSCWASEECLSSMCVGYQLNRSDGRQFRSSFCVEACAENGTCPEGTHCESIGDSRICSPTDLIRDAAERRFDQEKRLGLENRGFGDRRLQRELVSRDGGHR